MTYPGGVLRQHIAEGTSSKTKRCLLGMQDTEAAPRGTPAFPQPPEIHQLDTGPSTAPDQEQRWGRPEVSAGAPGEGSTQNTALTHLGRAGSAQPGWSTWTAPKPLAEINWAQGRLDRLIKAH